MFGVFQKVFGPSENDSLSRSFSRLGWLGFWMQVAVGAIPLALTIYAFVFGRNAAPGTRAGFPLIEYLSIAGLALLGRFRCSQQITAACALERHYTCV